MYIDLLARAYSLAQSSPDPSTKNAAILIDQDMREISVGINEFPLGVTLKPERLERPLKYKVMEHAERNAIYAAARAGRSTSGATMICPWAACSDCARAIIQSGVTKLVRHMESMGQNSDRWGPEIEVADQMFHEAGLMVVDFSWTFGSIENLRDGKIWHP